MNMSEKLGKLWDDLVDEVREAVKAMDDLFDQVRALAVDVKSMPPKEYARKKRNKRRIIKDIRSNYRTNLKVRKHLPYQRRNY